MTQAKRRQRQRWPFIKKRTYSTGAFVWSVDARTKSGGERKVFDTLTEAETFAEQCRIRRTNEGDGAFGNEELARYGKTVQDAISFYLEHLRQQEKSVPVETAIAELVELKRKAGRSDRYCKDIALRLKRLKPTFDGRTIASITTHELDAWLAGLPVGAVTRNTFRRDVRTLFSFCERRGYTPKNPAKFTERAAHVSGPPVILTVAEAKQLLQACSGQTLIYAAIGIFAGLRPTEVLDLDWSHIKLEGGRWSAGLIDVVPRDKTKTIKRRFVDVHPNLREWLLPHAKPSGPVILIDLRKPWRKARRKAGWAPEGTTTEEEKKAGVKLRPWVVDVMRHTFGSYWLGKYQDVAALELQMGNSKDVIMSHYRERVSHADAAAFWEIRASSEKEAVQIAAAP